MDGIYFYKLNSPYSEDVTKNCRLTVNEIDSNFLTLKDKDIKDVEFDCEDKTITLIRNNGEKVQTDLSCALSGIAKNFNVTLEEESGETGSGILTFTWEDNDNKIHSQEFKGLVTKNNIGDYVMTSVITDGSIIGSGRDGNPLKLNPLEQTGHYKPVKKLIDVINDESLPENNKLGDRYLTIENIDDYGFLYTIEGAKEIANKLSKDDGWRIPTKEDWDNMLNAIEPCEYRNHNSVRCHVQLGKVAGQKLKTSNWPYSAATNNNNDGSIEPKEKPINSNGINEYDFSVVPGGFAYEPNGEIQKFGKVASFWASTQIMPESDGDYFAKTFSYNMAGVWQSAECPNDFRSLRLVKDYDGHNASESAYIDGQYYEEVLMPSLNAKFGHSIWTKENIRTDLHDDKKQISYSVKYDTKPHKEYIINEWNGNNWERKIMPEGSVITINSEYDGNSSNTEYRLIDGKLEATDKIIFERVTKLFNDSISGINKSINDILSATTALSGEINTEKSERISADTELSNRIESAFNSSLSAVTEINIRLENEIQRAISADTALSGEINTERSERISADTALSGAIPALSDTVSEEINRATERENEIESNVPQGGEYVLSATTTLNIPSKTDGKNNIYISFDGNFGEF